MAENTAIEWCHHTFNPWTGCTKVSPACDNCYAEGWAKRSGHVEWGPHGARRRTKTWGNPVKWDNQARIEGRRFRVFCASLSDVFDNHKTILPEWRHDLWELIRTTPNLDWLLLTKRPQNIQRYLPEGRTEPYPNVWLGTTVENQKEADRRTPMLCQIPATVHFLSCEPLLGPLDVSRYLRPHGDKFGVNWVITGGESGPNFRAARPDWFRGLRDQCAAAKPPIPFLFKQWEGTTQQQIKAMGRRLDGDIHDAYPRGLS